MILQNDEITPIDSQDNKVEKDGIKNINNFSFGAFLSKDLGEEEESRDYRNNKIHI
jgi:hypothetical protein